MNEEIYKELASDFERYQIQEEVEDVLLDMAERVADQKAMEEERTVKEKYGKTTVELCGVCYPDEYGADEPSVYVKWIRIGAKEYPIEDYLL